MEEDDIMVLINCVIDDYTTYMAFEYQDRVFVYDNGLKTIMSKKKYIKLL